MLDGRLLRSVVPRGAMCFWTVIGHRWSADQRETAREIAAVALITDP